MIGWAAAAAGIAALALVGASLRWWERRAWSDPARDPAASRVGNGARAALDALLSREELPPAQVVAEALAICEVDELLSWRSGLARVAAHVAALGPSAEERALAAEHALRSGRPSAARALLDGLPADHWRVCQVRAGLYAIERDPERAESAWVAVAQLGPPEVRARATERVYASRRRRGVAVPPHVLGWERPPER